MGAEDRNREELERQAPSYEDFDLITIPEDVPEANIKAGDRGTVVEILGGTLLVDVVDPSSGHTLDVLHLDPGPPLKIVGRWRVNEER